MPISVDTYRYVPTSWFKNKNYPKQWIEEFESMGFIKVKILKQVGSKQYLVELPTGKTEEIGTPSLLEAGCTGE